MFDTNERIADSWACEFWIEIHVSKSFLTEEAKFNQHTFFLPHRGSFVIVRKKLEISMSGSSE